MSDAMLIEDMACTGITFDTPAAITVMADDITLDLNGYGIYNDLNDQTGYGVIGGGPDPLKGFTITNGEIGGFFFGVGIGFLFFVQDTPAAEYVTVSDVTFVENWIGVVLGPVSFGPFQLRHSLY